MEFLLTIHKVLPVMFEIFLIILSGFLLFRFKMLSNETLKGLTSLTINLFLPCLIFNHLINRFSFNGPKDWWIYPILGIVVSLIGIIIGRAFLILDRSIQNRREFMSLVAFQNCGYLPLLLVARIFPEPVAGNLFIYIFLFIQGFNLIFWSFGVGLLREAGSNPQKLKGVINAPFMALLLSLLLISLKLQSFIPKPIIQATQLIGDCTLPIGLITLGAVLAAHAGPVLQINRFLLKVIAAKLIVMPVLALLFICKFRLPYLMALVLIIETSMPSAVNLSIVSHHQNSKSGIVSQGVLLTHLFGLGSIPLFLSIFIWLGRY